MKQIVMPVLLMISLITVLAACHRSSTSIVVSESGGNMKIKVEDYSEGEPILFTGNYDIRGMDSAQRKELSQRVLDSVGHGKYK